MTPYADSGHSAALESSQLENEPSYQSNVQSTGVRTVPDVAYVGDPNTGLAVYERRYAEAAARARERLR